MLSDCRRVLDCAHDDECSFKLTSAEARRSADDESHGACANATEREKKPRQEYRRHRRRSSAQSCTHTTLLVRTSSSVYYCFAGQYKHHIRTLCDGRRWLGGYRGVFHGEIGDLNSCLSARKISFVFRVNRDDAQSETGGLYVRGHFNRFEKKTNVPPRNRFSTGTTERTASCTIDWNSLH